MQILHDDSITQTIQYLATVDEKLFALNKDQMHIINKNDRIHVH
jgi:hypothetical protein